MWRGCFSSCRYSASCLLVSWRPNQVFHQKRNGIRTMSHAVTKNSSRLRVDMRVLFRGLGILPASSDEVCVVEFGETSMGGGKYSRKRVRTGQGNRGRSTKSFSRFCPLLHHVCIEHAVLLEVMGDCVLR